MPIDVFSACQEIIGLFETERDQARNKVIILLDLINKSGGEIPPILNALIRETGLYPYINKESASWQERFVCAAFSENVGDVEDCVLHRDQMLLLRKLLSGVNVAVSAPTSFGKSFVIDSFIQAKMPDLVVIIVPTISLMDETRRRLTKKFSHLYNVITAPNQNFGDKNLLVFTQERAISYLAQIERIDLLVVDEFYKISDKYDKDRSLSLMRAVFELSKKSDQLYLLAPNIDEFSNHGLPKDIEFLRIRTNTVYLKKFDYSDECSGNEVEKSKKILSIVRDHVGKTLIYAGSHSNIEKISNILIANMPISERGILSDFSAWISSNYSPGWKLAQLVVRGIGVHNGNLHRSLGQVQIRLFDDKRGIDYMVSTSSIIEGVNTSAENVIIWSNKLGKAKMDDFSYRNIMGRGGRMFRHFVGNVFMLDKPPRTEESKLDIDVQDKVLGTLDVQASGHGLTADQLAKIHHFNSEMTGILGIGDGEDHAGTSYCSSNTDEILSIAKKISEGVTRWGGISMINSRELRGLEGLIMSLMRLKPGVWGDNYTKISRFIPIWSKNWMVPLPRLVDELDEIEVGIEDYFKLEKNISHHMSSLLTDFEIIYNKINPQGKINISAGISNFSNCFLPSVVYHLEEYGLPRCVSRKIQASGYFDFEGRDVSLDMAVTFFQTKGADEIARDCDNLDSFDCYILDFFIDGLKSIHRQ